MKMAIENQYSQLSRRYNQRLKIILDHNRRGGNNSVVDAIESATRANARVHTLLNGRLHKTRLGLWLAAIASRKADRELLPVIISRLMPWEGDTK